MPKLNEVLSTVAADGWDYFVKNNKVANNAVVVGSAVATPDLINVITNITDGVNVQAAIQQGGSTLYIALGMIVARFVLYLLGKAKDKQIVTPAI